MVLESLVSVREALENPLWVFIVGGFVSTTSLLVSFLLFSSSIGLMSTVLNTIALTPFMVSLLRFESALTEKSKVSDFVTVFQRHKIILKIYVALFAGMIFSYSIIYTILPEKYVEKLFEDQIEQIKLIRGQFLGGTFLRILLNNLGVLTVCYLFSFLYGAGAVFILSWNASVLATAIGLSAKALGGFKALPLAVMIYLPHGSLELIGYFMGGIAGGILSSALKKGRLYTFSRILKDSLIFFAWGASFIILGAIVESLLIYFS